MAASTSMPVTVPAEHGLSRRLTAGRQAMLAVGGAIGTGLFLGSGLSINVAGPAVVLSYVVAALVSLCLGAGLTEMAVAHPTAGSFGVYAGTYVSPFAGYAVRLSYWLMQVIATGGHLIAVSVYMQYWFPAVPGAVWILAFAVALLYLNTRTVWTFGEFEYWLSLVKVAAITVFIVLGLSMIVGLTGGGRVGVGNYVAHGGFAPFGARGIWFGVCFVIYAFIGVEIIGISSGEAVDPRRTIPAAMGRLIVILSLVYIVAMTVLVGVIPWPRIGMGESPFVSVLGASGVAGAASLMNLVVMTAALSSANACLYLITRTLFSLARAGFVPASFGAVSRRAVPVNALLVSSVGIAAAVLVRALWPDSAYVWFFGASLFGALFVWLMIFVTHLAFRRRWDRPDAGPLPFRLSLARPMSIFGGVAMVAMLATTWWVPGLRVTLLAGPPWLALVTLGYVLTRRGTPLELEVSPEAGTTVF
jgi:AAT family amino acid transporter